MSASQNGEMIKNFPKVIASDTIELSRSISANQKLFAAMQHEKSIKNYPAKARKKFKNAVS